VELTLGSGYPGLRKIALAPQGDVYHVSAVPIPQDLAPSHVKITASFPAGTISGTAENLEMKVEGRQFKLSDVKLINGAVGNILLADGIELRGKLAGLNAVLTDLGGITTTVDFRKATRVDIAQPTRIDWRIKASSNGKILKEASGELPIADKAAPGGSVTFGSSSTTSPHVRQSVPWYRSELVWAIIVSGVRLAIGFAVSIVAGATLGLLMWRIEGVDKFIGPLFLGLQTLPSVCWVPLAVLVFGLNERGIMFVLVMGSFSAAALSLRDGLRTIPPLYPRAGLMLGARNWKLYRYVLLPASLPALAGSLRTGFSFAWRSLMGAELVLTAIDHRGLGFLLALSRDLGGIADVVAVMIIMVVIGILADRWVFAVLQQKVQARFGLK
jgi:NitT/TauT family transport system permease protein